MWNYYIFALIYCKIKKYISCHIPSVGMSLCVELHYSSWGRQPGVGFLV